MQPWLAIKDGTDIMTRAYPVNMRGNADLLQAHFSAEKAPPLRAGRIIIDLHQDQVNYKDQDGVSLDHVIDNLSSSL